MDEARVIDAGAALRICREPLVTERHLDGVDVHPSYGRAALSARLITDVVRHHMIPACRGGIWALCPMTNGGRCSRSTWPMRTSSGYICQRVKAHSATGGRSSWRCQGSGGGRGAGCVARSELRVP